MAGVQAGLLRFVVRTGGPGVSGYAILACSLLKTSDNMIEVARAARIMS